MSNTIYVLLCKNNRYYIGKTKNPLNERILDHFSGNGSAWTQKYKPIKVIEKISNADDFDEDKITKKYMSQYGINRVRGGSYTQINLPECSLLSLKRELSTASDICYRCNRYGHFINQCYATTNVDGIPLDDEAYTTSESEEEYSSSEDEYISNKKYNSCYRCGRSGHYANNCYANFHINGYNLDA